MKLLKTEKNQISKIQKLKEERAETTFSQHELPQS
jgi:hypothetical protein